MLHVVAIVQARLKSTRLPGKVLLPAPDGRPLLAILLERLKRAKLLDEIVVAIPWDEDFPPLGVPVIRGPADDVLARYFEAAQTTHATHIVRITGDCPLLDPAAVDTAAALLIEAELQYVRTSLEWPEGLDVEAFTDRALWLTHKNARKPSEREHVTLWMRDGYDEPIHTFLPPNKQHLGHIRVTLDEQADYDVICAILRELGTNFELDDLVSLYDLKPELFAANAYIERNAGLRKSLEAER